MGVVNPPVGEKGMRNNISKVSSLESFRHLRFVT